MLTDVIGISFIGFLACVYGFFVEHRLKKDRNYKAICDWSDTVSCTKTFLSPWGALLGISNIYPGMLFYAGMMMLGMMHQAVLAFIGACIACIISLFLAYILYAKARTCCLMCMSIYIINIVLLYVTYQRL